MFRFISASVVAAAALLGMSGFAAVSAAGSAVPATTGSAVPATPIATSSADAHASAVNVRPAIRAIRTARRAVGGRPYDIERERFRGRRVWEVKLVRAAGRPREVLVSANGRRVLLRDTTGRSDEAGLARGARVGLVAAIRKAALRANGRFEDAEIDDHRGRVVWAVSFESRRFETDIYIRIDNGAIVGVDRDDD